MKNFRIVYWMGSMLTDRYIMAKNESDALKSLRKCLIKIVWYVL